MSKFVSLDSFISTQIAGDWGKDSFEGKFDTKVSCVRGADINEINIGNYNELPVRFIQKNKSNKFLSEGNIIIEISGGSPSQSTGRVCYIKKNEKNIICSNFCRALIVKEDHSAKYYYYLLRNIYNSNVFFNFESKTSGIKNLLLDVAFQSIKAPFREKKEQQKIAAIFSVLDDKIELNNRINAELELMAKTLYDYWFVQFDFPNAKDKPYKASGGKMVYNEVLKREIPEGWEIGSFADWIKETKAGDWGKDTEEGNYTQRVFCVRGADINGINGKGEVKAPERFILKSNASKALLPNDFIIEISGGSPTQSTGRIALVSNKVFERFNAPVICSNFCKALSLKDEKYTFNFQQEWQRLYDANIFFGFEGKTSGIKNFLFDSFIGSYQVILPPKALAEKFFDFAKSIEEKKQTNLLENQQLAALRDWLLPMLMNGQAKVK